MWLHIQQPCIKATLSLYGSGKGTNYVNPKDTPCLANINGMKDRCHSLHHLMTLTAGTFIKL